ncbi:MAG: flippase-like domain-containing protein [Prevotellaceae bacterium]|jgi:hypothetical protein|nr:flippase-like domain-containing protein [Prevotellaceae bacterium]
MSAKKIIYRIISWAVVVSAYVFLGYQLYRFDDYGAFFEWLSQSDRTHYKWLLLTLALLPFNILFEALKWQRLLRHLSPVSLREATRQVLWGQTGAFFTPNRLGEFPTRALALPEGKRLSGIALGFIGSLAQTIVISAVGVVSCLFFVHFVADKAYQPVIQQTAPVVGALAGVMLVGYFLLPLIGKLLHRFPRLKTGVLVASLNEFTLRESLPVLLLSAIRYAIFSVQYYTILQFFGVDISLEQAAIAIPTFNLFLSYIPTVTVAELGVRTSFAALVIGAFSTNTLGIIFSSAMIWAINFCLPMIAGSIFVRNIHR